MPNCTLASSLGKFAFSEAAFRGRDLGGFWSGESHDDTNLPACLNSTMYSMWVAQKQQSQ